VRFEELRRLLELSGWELQRIRGSHHTFKRGSAVVTVPLRRPHVLPVYVRQVLDATRPEEGEDGDQDDD
jgi:predicted RNA binding protein YcfA (HicA-like mRNA interferase family)